MKGFHQPALTLASCEAPAGRRKADGRLEEVVEEVVVVEEKSPVQLRRRTVMLQSVTSAELSAALMGRSALMKSFSPHTVMFQRKKEGGHVCLTH